LTHNLQVKADVAISCPLFLTLFVSFLLDTSHITSIPIMSHPTLHLRAEVRASSYQLNN
jgi:hypothetical protein